MESFIHWMENRKNIIFQNEFGYISGYKRSDGYYWIEEFVIHPEFRGKGLAKQLMQHLPQKAKLLAYPLVNMEGMKLSQKQLIQFYLNFGFQKTEDEHGNIIMQRD